MPNMRRLVNGKVDEGFEWIYFNLSYRRKFIRTLWVLGLGSVGFVLVVPVLKETWPLIAFACLIPVGLGQAAYNWTMWNKHERSFSPQKPNGDG